MLRPPLQRLSHFLRALCKSKYLNQVNGRQSAIRRADLGAAGIFYRALVGPFASVEKAKLCSGLKAAGGDLHRWSVTKVYLPNVKPKASLQHFAWDSELVKLGRTWTNDDLRSPGGPLVAAGCCFCLPRAQCRECRRHIILAGPAQRLARPAACAAGHARPGAG
jgi:hypothetical protein